MNTNNFQKTIEEKIKSLPKELLTAMQTSNWGEVLTTICQKNNIIKEKNKIELEVFMVLVGIADPLDFDKQLKNILSAKKEEEIKNILSEIIEKIFNAIFTKAKELGWKDFFEMTEEEIKSIKKPKEESLEAEDFLLFEAYTEAPEKIKDFFRGGELPEKIQKIGETFGLKEEEKSIIEAVLTVNILVKIDNQKIREDLKERLVERKEKFEEIFKEIEKEIILPLVKNLNEGVKKFEEKINQTQSTTKDVRLPEELKKKFYDLPEDLRWAISEINVEEKMLELKQKYNLNIEQAGFVSSLIYSILVGHTHPEKFEENLRMVVRTTPENINEILIYINQNIFGGVREKILSLHKEKDKKAIFIEEENTKKEIPQNESLLALKKLIEKEKIETKTTEESSDQKNINLANSIFAQKLSGNFKIPKTETEHKIIQNTQGISSIKKIDPYREIPE